MINLANLGILFLLFTFLGLPWLFIVTGSLMSITLIDGIRHAVTIIDALQGPALFVIRVGRLKVARQFWKRLLCCCKFKYMCVHAGSESN